MAVSFTRLGNSLPFSRLFRYLHSSDDILDRQLEQEMETVIAVLQPGPLGIVEHKFSSEEMREANATVKRAVENWRRNANLEARVE
ncbi:uncharacterized protein LOC131323011 isoform X1 [Rhododendron vialii]|uniref:uncharacterized protein LOC131323011 isoform X1 n=1 Tax=Rhododendron vialii TaxID=182163 RepID=UPI00265E2DBE|nr:uncharacterized protein LOC131323011 isoform X1 [Rhododendron vialii]